jgi:hypothetical protein
MSFRFCPLNRLRLVESLRAVRAFANEYRLPEQATLEETTEILLDQFKRVVTQVLAAIELRHPN